jgi:hypothetical protein
MTRRAERRGNMGEDHESNPGAGVPVHRSMGLYLLLLGIGALLVSALLSPHRAARWLFASHRMPEGVRPLLLGLRIAGGSLGLILVIFGVRIGRRWDRFWNALPPAKKLVALDLGLLAAATAMYGLAVFWERDLVLGEWIDSIRRHATILGFSVVLPKENFGVVEAIDAFFLLLCGGWAFVVYGMLRWYRPGPLPYPMQRTFWFLVGVGGSWMALDEYLGIQDFLRMQLSQVLPSTRGLPIEIGVIYPILALLIGWRARRYLIAHRRGSAFLIAAVGMGLLSQIVDPFVESEALTELPEALASGLMLGALLQYGIAEFEAILRARGIDPQASR